MFSQRIVTEERRIKEKDLMSNNRKNNNNDVKKTEPVENEIEQPGENKRKNISRQLPLTHIPPWP